MITDGLRPRYLQRCLLKNWSPVLWNICRGSKRKNLFSSKFLGWSQYIIPWAAGWAQHNQYFIRQWAPEIFWQYSTKALLEWTEHATVLQNKGRIWNCFCGWRLQGREHRCSVLSFRWAAWRLGWQFWNVFSWVCPFSVRTLIIESIYRISIMKSSLE